MDWFKIAAVIGLVVGPTFALLALARLKVKKPDEPKKEEPPKSE